MARKTAIPRRLPKPVAPDSAEREYYRLLRRYVERYIVLMKAGLEQVVPKLREQMVVAPRMDGKSLSVRRYDANAEKSIRALLESVGKKLATEFPDSTLTRWAESMVGHVNRIGKSNIAKLGEAVSLDVEPLLHDNDLSPYFRTVVENNVGLIKSIPQSRMVAFKNRLIQAMIRDASQDEIRKIIQENFDATRSQARLIARDQTNKLNAKVHEYRQRQLGGKRYRWRGSQDARERPDHRRLEGQVFYWSKPPITNRSTGARNNPGEDIQCRCWAEMIMEDVLQ